MCKVKQGISWYYTVSVNTHTHISQKCLWCVDGVRDLLLNMGVFMCAISPNWFRFALHLISLMFMRNNWDACLCKLQGCCCAGLLCVCLSGLRCCCQPEVQDATLQMRRVFMSCSIFADLHCKIEKHQHTKPDDRNHTHTSYRDEKCHTAVVWFCCARTNINTHAETSADLQTHLDSARTVWMMTEAWITRCLYEISNSGVKHIN